MSLSTNLIILAGAMLVTGFGIGIAYGIAIGARSARLPSPGPDDQCDGGCALAALPRDRDLILRRRGRDAGPRTSGIPAAVGDDTPPPPGRRRRPTGRERPDG